MSEDTWFLGVVPTIAGDLITVPTDETTLQAILAASGGGGGGGTFTSSNVGAANFVTSQVSVNTSITLIAAARTGAAGTGRISAKLYNNGTGEILVGGPTVSPTTGIPLFAGESESWATTEAIYGISLSGTQIITVVETF